MLMQLHITNEYGTVTEVLDEKETTARIKRAMSAYKDTLKLPKFKPYAKLIAAVKRSEARFFAGEQNQASNMQRAREAVKIYRTGKPGLPFLAVSISPYEDLT